LDPGYGATLGNALRRILLRSLPGAAITRIRIADVWHEFATVEGVREDVTEIVLNVKGVRLRALTEFHEARATLFAQGEGVVRAGDIDWPNEVEVVNPDHVIATLDNDDARLEMDLVIGRGRGYVPAEQQSITMLGEIPIDALYTPIVKVNYVVEHTRVGQMTDYDRLIIEIVTDGTIDPAEALREAARILVEHAQIIADFERAAVAEEPEAEARVRVEDNRLLSELGLSQRVLNALRARGIERVSQALAYRPEQLRLIRNFGPRALQELRKKLAEFGYVDGPLFADTGLAEAGVGRHPTAQEVGTPVSEEEGED
jgi:DNA-directed RNA polymerase subunit alpha